MPSHILTMMQFAKAHDTYYLAIEQFRAVNNARKVGEISKVISDLYSKAKDKNVVFNFPKAKKEETIIASRSIESIKKSTHDAAIEATIDGGSNDGVYEGAEAEVYGKHRKDGEDRANRLLGTAKIIEVKPNFSKVQIQLINPKDTFYNVYEEDLVAVPIRFPQNPLKDLFLEVSLMNIKFLDNYGKLLAHPRTLMYYASPQLEKEVYQRMLDAVEEIYAMIKDDSKYDPKEKITRGRFKGITWKEAMGRSSASDLKAFLGFVRNYPGKYMGGTWKISETYATWLLSNAPPGSIEIMDSLLVCKNDTEFRYFLNAYEKELKKSLTAPPLIRYRF